MRSLTVVQLLPALESGGVERSTIEVADALVQAGHRAIVVSAGGRLLPTLLATGAGHVTLPIGAKSMATLRHVATLRRLFADCGADIVHARSRLPAWLAWLALRNAAPGRARLVTTVHGLNSPSRYSAIMTRGAQVICVSDTVRDYVLQHYPRTDPAILRVIPRGIDVARFPPAAWPDGAARAAVAALHPALGGEGPLLLLPGRGTRLKGHGDALALLRALRGGVAQRDARLWMPGALQEGREGYIAELRAQAASLGLSDVVAITEATADIQQAYAACDLVLQTSRKPESFGRTVIEALAVGRPVVGWAHGGVGELLQALQPEGAVAPFDAAMLLAQAGALLQRAPTPAATMPAIVRDYSLHAMQRATLACYTELCLADDRSTDSRRHAATR